MLTGWETCIIISAFSQFTVDSRLKRQLSDLDTDTMSAWIIPTGKYNFPQSVPHFPAEALGTLSRRDENANNPLLLLLTVPLLAFCYSL